MKIKAGLIVIVLLVITLFGCSSNSLIQYKDSIKKTDNISKGKTSINLTINSSYNYEGLDKKEAEKLSNYFNKIEIDSNITFDDTKEEMYLMMYFNFGGLGYDSEVFVKGNETTVRIPIINKYIKIENEQEQNKDNELYNNINEKILKPIKDKWTEILLRENVVKGKKSILSTEDGDVKVIKYTITPSEEQMKELITFCFKTVAENKEVLKDELTLIGSDNETDIETFISKLGEELKKIETITLEQVVYIDIDGYITKDTVNFELYINNPEQGEARYRKIVLETKNWNNEMEQLIVFPTIKSKDVIDVEDSKGSFMFFLEEE